MPVTQSSGDCDHDCNCEKVTISRLISNMAVPIWAIIDQKLVFVHARNELNVYFL